MNRNLVKVKKGRNSGSKDEEGDRLWEHVTRSVKAYSSSPKRNSKKSESLSKTVAVSKPDREVMRKISTTVTPAAASGGFDRATETKFRRGQLPLESKLDLHGMTQGEAFEALSRFILSAAAFHKRTLLVITGKGQKSEGVLKRMLPLWLEDPSLKARILALAPAQPKHGGSGAFYIRLRRER